MVVDELRCILSPVQLGHITSDAFVRNPRINHHHVAVVYSCKTGGVLASGTNCATAYGSTHAEVSALAQFRSRWRDGRFARAELSKGVGVVSLRVAPSGRLRLAKPCDRCQSCLASCPLVRFVQWSTQEGELECLRCA